VALANERCDQENVIEQLKNGRSWFSLLSQTIRGKSDSIVCGQVAQAQGKRE
jgi:hypothetical protein